MRVIALTDTGIEVAVREAASVLKTGGIVLYPTDTLYGLGVDALNTDAVERLCTLKGRDAGKFISCVVAGVEDIESYATLSTEAGRLARAHLPGPLTLALPTKIAFPDSISWDGGVRIRIPNDPFALALAREFGGPYTSTSANISGKHTAETPELIIEQFGEYRDVIDLVISDGPRSGGTPSTVVRAMEETPVIVREGVLTALDLGI